MLLTRYCDFKKGGNTLRLANREKKQEITASCVIQELHKML